ncbi:hypothetical protein SNOG_05054 [Parastagonospora nodorum SN15]|uniref:Uncharacterized protein n=1 Tax=Phaeosphaeria nodorum (strain SN15 / ATCC MYA-4574 / FGSC 10173) TaxID=321614 RepID=Q0UT60_PHANO|nr:hypothetical protein SNOG_05054 [Parastagonospora nodorum SN15]EAT87445.1 hypothetical protein SNOG_05054 [Parastagonospora nodorum SN15]
MPFNRHRPQISRSDPTNSEKYSLTLSKHSSLKRQLLSSKSGTNEVLQLDALRHSLQSQSHNPHR